MEDFANPVLDIRMTLEDIHFARHALKEYAETFDRFMPDHAQALRAAIHRLDDAIEAWIKR